VSTSLKASEIDVMIPESFLTFSSISPRLISHLSAKSFTRSRSSSWPVASAASLAFPSACSSSLEMAFRSSLSFLSCSMSIDRS